jgi:hypothetical protein
VPGIPVKPGFHFQTRRTRTLVLKCQCGAIWQYREGPGPFPPGTEPIPTGDSFTCKKCGRSIDLKQERQLESEALGNLNAGDMSSKGMP